MTGLLRDRLQTSLGSAYTLERELGGGGMSRVFVAREEALGRTIVLKVLPPELAAELSADRFAREVRVAAQLQDPHIVPVLTAGDADGLPYYTMPYVAGDSLRERLRREPRPPLAESVEVLRGMLLALAAAHEAGVVHRDIKPENVLLTRAGTPAVTDFGIAKAVAASRTQAEGPPADGALTRVGTSLGTPAYMAPEQAAGADVDHRADLYAWGVVAYELLAGAHPFAGKTNPQQLVAAHLMERPAPLAPLAADAPADLARLVHRALAKAPDDRPGGAHEMLRLLDAATGRSTSGAGTPDGPSLGRRARVGITAVLLLIAAGAAVATRRGRSAAAPALSPARVVVLPFDNRTGDPALEPLGAMAADWITRGLTETGLVDVAPLPAGATPAGAAAVASARAARAGTLLAGTVYRVGDSVRVVATITDVNAGTISVSLAPVAAPTANPMAALEQLRRHVAGALARRVDPTFDPDRLQGVPPSFETYRAVLDAGVRARAGDLEGAAEAFRRIGTADTTYAMPLLEELGVRSNLRDAARMDTLLVALERRRAQLTPYEQARLDLARATHEHGLGGSLNEARHLVALAPRSASALTALAAQLLAANRMAEAHATLRRIDTTRLGNKNANWFALAFASHALGEYARELGEVDAALRADPTASVLLDARVRALTALGRTHDVAATLATADRAGPRAAATAYATASSELLAHGHPVEAARAQQAVVERARAFRATNDLRGIAPFTVRWLVPAAALGLLGRASEALALIDSATAELATDPRQRLATGMATDLPLWGVSLRGAVAAHNGDSATALAADRLLVTLRPAPGIARASALVGRAAIAAQLGRRDDAVARLREAIAAGATFGGTNAWSVLRPASGIRPESPWFAPLRGYAPFEDLVRPVR